MYVYGNMEIYGLKSTCKFVIENGEKSQWGQCSRLCCCKPNRILVVYLKD